VRSRKGRVVSPRRNPSVSFGLTILARDCLLTLAVVTIVALNSLIFGLLHVLLA
jgi:hypothetical protein